MRPAATFTVTNTGDSVAGPLRQAILYGNGTPGADTTAFDVPGAGITRGCGGGNSWPLYPVWRDQMAVFLQKTKYGSSYVPPPCDGDFLDVACPSAFVD